MATEVVVVGAGYAGTGVVKALQSDPSIDLTWISDSSHHIVKHEIHRVIRSPSVADKLTIPVDRIRTNRVTFREDRMVGIDPIAQVIRLQSKEQVAYDYLVVTVGAKPAYYSIPGLEGNSQPLAGVEDALEINAALHQLFATDGSRVVIGGGGLTGVQVAGEIEALARAAEANVEIILIEALDTILSNCHQSLRERIHRTLEYRGISVMTGTPIVEATKDSVILQEDQEIPAELIIWTGGITGSTVNDDIPLELIRNRIQVDNTLQSSDEHVFALGDIAYLDQENKPIPPTAQAAWQAAPVAAKNVQASIAGRPLTPWSFNDKGTVVSVGDSAFAHGIPGSGGKTIGSLPATFLKKAIAARWIGGVSSWRRAAFSWSAL